MTASSPNYPVASLQTELNDLLIQKNLLPQPFMQLAAPQQHGERVEFVKQIIGIDARSHVSFLAFASQSMEDLKRLQQTMQRMYDQVSRDTTESSNSKMKEQLLQGLSTITKMMERRERQPWNVPNFDEKQETEEHRKKLITTLDVKIKEIRSIQEMLTKPYELLSSGERQAFQRNYANLSSEGQTKFLSLLSRQDLVLLSQNSYFKKNQQFISKLVETLENYKYFANLIKSDKAIFIDLYLALPDENKKAILDKQRFTDKLVFYEEERIQKEDHKFISVYKKEDTINVRNSLLISGQFLQLGVDLNGQLDLTDQQRRKAEFINKYVSLNDDAKKLVLNSQTEQSKNALYEELSKSKLNSELAFIDKYYKVTFPKMHGIAEKLSKQAFSKLSKTEKDKFVENYLQLNYEYKIKVLTTLSSPNQRKEDVESLLAYFNSKRGQGGAFQFGRDADRLISDIFLPELERERLSKLNAQKLKPQEQKAELNKLDLQLRGNLTSTWETQLHQKAQEISEPLARVMGTKHYHELSNNSEGVSDKRAFHNILIYGSEKAKADLLQQQSDDDKKLLIADLREFASELHNGQRAQNAADALEKAQTQKVQPTTPPAQSHHAKLFTKPTTERQADLHGFGEHRVEIKGRPRR